MTVLSETTRYTFTRTGGMIFLFGIILCMVFVAIGLRDDIMCLAIIGAVIGLATVICAGIYFKEPYQELKAIISDDYSAAELYDKYDVVGHDGKIWILEEKERQ